MSINSPLVTVIVPAYNAELYVSETIQSVLEQTFCNWELIVINDGSSDNTHEIIASFDDERIRLVDQDNRGVSVARNEGLSRAQGKYITFLDADDTLPPQSLELRVTYLEFNQNIDLVDGQICVKNSDMNDIIRIYNPYYTGRLLPRLVGLDSRVFFNVCYMFKKEILGDVLFVENMTHLEDLMFYIELASKRSVQYGFVTEPVYSYRSLHISAMADLDGLESGYFLFLSRVINLNGSTLLPIMRMRIKVTRIMFLTGWHKKNYKRAFMTIVLYMFLLW